MPMNETVVVEVSREQRELLLRGLRYVRSSVLLETREPSPIVVEEREEKLESILLLVDQLNGARPAPAPAPV